jgi:conjugal transfer ATP-binding protein TraC
MADDNTQNLSDTDAAMPEWLKNAQALASHEEKGMQDSSAVAGVGGQQPAVSQQVAVSRQQSVSTQTVSAPSAPQAVAVVMPVVSVSEPAKVAELADAPLPAWLKKASDEAIVAQATVAQTQGSADVSAPAGRTAAPEIVQVAESVLSPVPKGINDLVSQKAVIPDAGNAILSDTAANITKPAVPAEVPAQAVRVSAISVVPVAPAANAAQQASAVKPAVAVNSGAQKNDLFRSAESAFLSFLGKGKSVIQQSQTAGMPKTPVGGTIASGGMEENTSALVGAPAVGLTSSAAEMKTAADASAKPTPAINSKAPKVADATAKERQEMLDAEKIYQQGITTIRDLIAPSSMEIRYDMLRIEGMYSQTFYVYAYPRYLETNWLSPVINFDVTMDISQFIYPIDSATIMRVLKKKVAQMQATVRINAEKGIVSDPALETALQDAEELRLSITRGQEKFFQFALYFTIYSEDEKKIGKISKQLESILGGKLILTKRSEMQMEAGFNSCLPLALDELEVITNMNTSPLSSTFPFSSSDLTSNEGILYGLNRHNDSLIIFDRFSLENANSVVFAKSGAGKSYCVKLEILRSMMIGTDVIVIDPENEYEALAQTVGGAYLKVSLTSDRRINPFDLPPPIEGEEVQPGDLLRSNIINLHGLLKIMLGGVSPEEEGILDKALNDVYNLKGITMELVDPSTIPPPTMEDLYDILSTMEGGTSLAQRLQKFTSGTYSGIFNKPTNVNLESGLMVFSIRDLEDSLRPIAMYIILNYIWSSIRRKLKRRLLIIDEAWSLMQHDDSARFLFGLVKRARKYYLGITTITQDVEDFVKSPFGKPVVTNSSLQLLLKQAPSAVDVLGKVFNLTDGEKYMLLNSGVGQGLFFAGLKHVAIQVIASYTEDKIVTTNPEEILRGKEKAEVYEAAA